MKHRVIGFLSLLAMFCGATVLQAQFHDRDLPDNSIAWWTLTDELSPDDLREAHRSPLTTLKRYRNDVVAGKADPLSQEQGQELAFYVNAQSTPELIPLWFAFDVFVSDYFIRETRESLANQLRDFGASESGAQIILDTAARYQTLFHEATERIWPQQREFVNLYKRAKQALGGDDEAYRALRAAQARSDAAFLAPLGGETEARTAELLAAAKANPGLEAAERLLPSLRDTLADDDWRSLRAYLLREVAPGMGSLRELKD